jgi:hypothetical protein
MGIFDDGYQQSIIDTTDSLLTHPPTGFSSASYDTARQEDLSIVG